MKTIKKINIIFIGGIILYDQHEKFNRKFRRSFTIGLTITNEMWRYQGKS